MVAGLILTQDQDYLASLPADGITGILSALASGESASIAVLTDSTGYNHYNWPRQLGLFIADKIPAVYGVDLRVEYRRWNDATQSYDVPEILRAGTAGRRGVTFNKVRSRKSPLSAFWTDDIEIGGTFALASWSPSLATGDQTLLYCGASGVQAFRLVVLSDDANRGKLYLEWKAGGVTKGFFSTNPLGYADGQTVDLKATLDVDNGSGGYTATLLASTDGGATWTALRTSVTTAGVTSVDKVANSTVLVGGNQTALVMTGTVYDAYLRNGIGGGRLTISPIEQWQLDSGVDGTVTGSPTLYITNGTRPGGGLSYLNDAARLPKMLPIAPGLVMLATSHNDTTLENLAWLSGLDGWLAAVKARNPLANVCWLAENPRVAPASYIESHAKRVRQSMSWAVRNALPVIDGFRPFMALGGALPNYLEAVDGIHPNEARGSPLQCATVNAAFASRMPS